MVLISNSRRFGDNLTAMVVFMFYKNLSKCYEINTFNKFEINNLFSRGNLNARSTHRFFPQEDRLSEIVNYGQVQSSLLVLHA
jgi:hypothetical protein